MSIGVEKDNQPKWATYHTNITTSNSPINVGGNQRGDN